MAVQYSWWKIIKEIRNNLGAFWNCFERLTLSSKAYLAKAYFSSLSLSSSLTLSPFRSLLSLRDSLTLGCFTQKLVRKNICSTFRSLKVVKYFRQVSGWNLLQTIFFLPNFEWNENIWPKLFRGFINGKAFCCFQSKSCLRLKLKPNRNLFLYRLLKIRLKRRARYKLEP